MIKILWIFPIVLLGVVLLLTSRVPAFELTGLSWQVANPMGEDWRICPDGMPPRRRSEHKRWRSRVELFRIQLHVCRR